jgi:deazaflavin-dependent oxidoreductase (nitroreductase family)
LRTVHNTAVPETFLYLTTRGRKTGLPRRIEIWFVEHGGCHYVVAEGREHAGWVKNLRAHAQARFSVGERDDRERSLPTQHARARFVDPDQERTLAAAVRSLMDAKYAWSEGLIVELARVS